MARRPDPRKELLNASVLFAMPVGPPYGGMTSYTAMLRVSPLFAEKSAHLLDTTPLADGRKGLARMALALRRTLAMLHRVRTNRIEVVQFMTSDNLGFFEKAVMAFAAQAVGARAVLHLIGGFAEFYARAGWRRPVIRWILARMNAIIAVHPEVAAYIERLAPGADVWVIPNPVVCRRSPPIFPRPASGTSTVLFIGALKRAKGVLDFLELARRIRDRGVSARFVVIGEGPDAAICHAFVRQHRLDDIIELPGFVDEATKASLLAESSVFCLPTYSEGTPISVLEAMAEGMPIVSTTVGGIPFAVRHGENGWLFPPGDLAGMERAVLYLLAAPKVRIAMGRSGWKRAQAMFSIDTIVPMLIHRLNRVNATSVLRTPVARVKT